MDQPQRFSEEILSRKKMKTTHMRDQWEKTFDSSDEGIASVLYFDCIRPRSTQIERELCKNKTPCWEINYLSKLNEK